jgi:hypothetical protein
MYNDDDDDNEENDDNTNNPSNHWYNQILTGNIQKSQQVTRMFDKTK